ncbi:hypothetical protein ACQ4PT_035270 [Festuca glaucescens]
MEATAVSLARSVLEGVLRSAGSTVADEVALLLGVPREVEFIRSELEMMQSFLRAASARPDAAARNDTVRTWVKQVRDIAYDVEDCLFDFALYSNNTASSCSPSFWPLGSLATRRSIADRIRDLKARVEELNQRNQRYHLFVDPPRGAAEVDVQQQLLPYHDGPSDAEHDFQEWDIIGRSKEKEELINLISGSDDSPLAVVSVYGMGGMGKSSLVSMVRNDPELLDAYDYGAWVTVPHPLDSTGEFMRRLRKQLGLGAAAVDHDDDDIKEHLENKRYMIVLDDLLTKEEWDLVWPKLFNLKNAKGSRVIVTTRREDVARHCAGKAGHVYDLKPLEETEAMDLLCKKVYKEPKFDLSDEMKKQASYRHQKVAQLEMDNHKTSLLRNMATLICCNRSETSNMDQLISIWPPKGIEKLKNLHTFGVFNVGQGNGVARRLEQLSNLQRLGVTVTSLTEKGSRDFCQSVGKLGRLQKLEVRSHSLKFLAKMDELATPKHLSSLKLLGNLSLLPKWITSLNDLTKVKLLGTKLEQGQVDILGDLSSVAFLGLWERSYIGESLCFCAGKFPKLKFLDIDGLEVLQMVTVKEPEVKVLENDGQDKIEIKVHAMPELEQLWVQNCKKLRDSGDALSGVPHLLNLNELLVKQCGKIDNLIAILQWQVSQWQVSLHKKRPKFLIGKIIPTSSQPSTSAAARQ